MRRANVLEEQLEGMSMTEDEKAQHRTNLAGREREFSRLRRQQMCADHFEKLTIVGRGAFGEVRIVREKSSGKVLAMKKLKKEETLRRNQVRSPICPIYFMRIFTHLSHLLRICFLYR